MKKFIILFSLFFCFSLLTLYSQTKTFDTEGVYYNENTYDEYHIYIKFYDNENLLIVYIDEVDISLIDDLMAKVDFEASKKEAKTIKTDKNKFTYYERKAIPWGEYEDNGMHNKEQVFTFSGEFRGNKLLITEYEIAILYVSKVNNYYYKVGDEMVMGSKTLRNLEFKYKPFPKK